MTAALTEEQAALLVKSTHDKILQGKGASLLCSDSDSDAEMEREESDDGENLADVMDSDNNNNNNNNKNAAAANAQQRSLLLLEQKYNFPTSQGHVGNVEVLAVETTVELPLAKRNDVALATTKGIDVLLYNAPPGANDAKSKSKKKGNKKDDTSAAAAASKIIVDIVSIECLSGFSQTNKSTVKRTLTAMVRVAQVTSYGLMAGVVSSLPYDTYARCKFPVGDGSNGETVEMLMRCSIHDEIAEGNKVLCAAEPTVLRLLKMRDRRAAGKWIRRYNVANKTVILTFVPEEGSREARMVKRAAPAPKAGGKRKR